MLIFYADNLIQQAFIYSPAVYKKTQRVLPFLSLCKLDISFKLK